MSLQTISESLARSVAGEAWHGPALGELLADVTDTEAAAHPVDGAHSIVELVLHVAGWMEEVASRLEGHEPGLPSDGDWPPVRPWPEARARLTRAHERLQRALAAFPEARLTEKVGDVRDPPLGSGVSYAATLIGVTEHNAYHGGQVALLKRALRGSSA